MGASCCSGALGPSARTRARGQGRAAPSSKISSDRVAMRTKLWIRASRRTWGVVMTILTWARAPSQVDADQVSTISAPVMILVCTEGIWAVTTSYCCAHKGTVGARNQTTWRRSCQQNSRAARALPIGERRTWSSGILSSSARILRMALPPVSVSPRTETLAVLTPASFQSPYPWRI